MGIARHRSADAAELTANAAAAEAYEQTLITAAETLDGELITAALQWRQARTTAYLAWITEYTAAGTDAVNDWAADQDEDTLEAAYFVAEVTASQTASLATSIAYRTYFDARYAADAAWYAATSTAAAVHDRAVTGQSTTYYTTAVTSLAVYDTAAQDTTRTHTLGVQTLNHSYYTALRNNAVTWIYTNVSAGATADHHTATADSVWETSLAGAMGTLQSQFVTSAINRSIQEIQAGHAFAAQLVGELTQLATSQSPSDSNDSFSAEPLPVNEPISSPTSYGEPPASDDAAPTGETQELVGEEALSVAANAAGTAIGEIVRPTANHSLPTVGFGDVRLAEARHAAEAARARRNAFVDGAPSTSGYLISRLVAGLLHPVTEGFEAYELQTEQGTPSGPAVRNAIGFTAATYTGVRGISDAWEDEDALDAHNQSQEENRNDAVLGATSLLLAGTGLAKAASGAVGADDLTGGAANVAPHPTIQSLESGAGTGYSGFRGFELRNHAFQPLRNTSRIIEGRVFSGHALDQMQNRGIPLSVVQNAIEHGTEFAGSRAGTIGYYDPQNSVRVILNIDNGTVVTVMYGAP